MNKQELARAIADKQGCSVVDAVRTLDVVTSCITDALIEGDDVMVPGFGKFSVNRREAYTGRNPATGESMEIAAKNHPKFAPAKGLKDSVNG